MIKLFFVKQEWHLEEKVRKVYRENFVCFGLGKMVLDKTNFWYKRKLVLWQKPLVSRHVSQV